MFTVKVVDTSSGRPVKGAKVSVGFNGLSTTTMERELSM